jgi:hypothetical protein
MEKIENLFYSKAQKRLFWIPGYAALTCDKLMEKVTEACALFDSPPGEICWDVINNSRRYKNMIIFDMKSEGHPGAFEINGTLQDWIAR